MKDTVLSVKNLGVSFGDLTIFKKVEFKVNRGEAVAIIGPNGAGKTVLFKALIGSLSYQGEVAWARGIKIGYVPQRLPLDRYLSLTLYDFMVLKPKISKLPLRDVDEALKLVRLPKSRLKRPLGYLSAGELQRALIAFALIGSPDILLFDEPTAGVDVSGEEQIYKMLHNFQDQKHLTLIFISHDLNLVYRYADKVICLNRSMFCFGKPEEALSPKILDKLYGAKVMHHFHQHD